MHDVLVSWRHLNRLMVIGNRLVDKIQMACHADCDAARSGIYSLGDIPPMS